MCFERCVIVFEFQGLLEEIVFGCFDQSRNIAVVPF